MGTKTNAPFAKKNSALSKVPQNANADIGVSERSNKVVGAMEN